MTVAMSGWLLLVEQDPRQREDLAELLEVSGLEVTACANVEEALAALDVHGRPDFVVTDLAMAELSGVSLAAEIRRRVGFESVPVAFLTDTEPEVWADIAEPVVKKPVDAEYLLGLIAEQCSRCGDARAL